MPLTVAGAPGVTVCADCPGTKASDILPPEGAASPEEGHGSTRREAATAAQGSGRQGRPRVASAGGRWHEGLHSHPSGSASGWVRGATRVETNSWTKLPSSKHQASSKLRHCSCMIYNYPCDEPDSSDSTLYCICVRSHVRVNCISSPARCAATRSATGSAIAAAAATGASGASGLGRRARASPSSSAPPSSGRRVGPRGSAASGWRRLVVKSGTSSILGAAGGGLLGPPQASQLLRRRASSWRSAA